MICEECDGGGAVHDACRKHLAGGCDCDSGDDVDCDACNGTGVTDTDEGEDTMSQVDAEYIVIRLAMNADARREYFVKYPHDHSGKSRGYSSPAACDEWHILCAERDDLVEQAVKLGRELAVRDTAPWTPPSPSSAHQLATEACSACDRTLDTARRMRAAGAAK